jgi:hypothetical protein
MGSASNPKIWSSSGPTPPTRAGAFCWPRCYMRAG